jgi:hypothetical protein
VERGSVWCDHPRAKQRWAAWTARVLCLIVFLVASLTSSSLVVAASSLPTRLSHSSIFDTLVPFYFVSQELELSSTSAPSTVLHSPFQCAPYPHTLICLAICTSQLGRLVCSLHQQQQQQQHRPSNQYPNRPPNHHQSSSWNLQQYHTPSQPRQQSSTQQQQQYGSSNQQQYRPPSQQQHTPPVTASVDEWDGSRLNFGSWAGLCSPWTPATWRVIYSSGSHT